MALNSGPFECALQPESEVLRTQRPTWRVLLRKRVDPSKPTTPDVNFPRIVREMAGTELPFVRR